MKIILRNFRKGIVFFQKFLLLSIVVASYFYTLYHYYEKSIYENKGNFVLILLYAVIFLLFMNTYGGFKIGILRQRELFFSFFLAICITNFISYFVVDLIVREMVKVFPLLLLTLFQVAVAIVVYYFANKIYFSLYPARNCIVICTGTENELSIVRKFGSMKERYHIGTVCNESIGYDALMERMETYSTVIIGEVETELRLKLMTYCYENNKRLFIVPTMQDIMLNKAHETQIGDSLVYLCKNRTFTFEQLIIKRLLDIIVSLIGIVITSPIMLITAILIKCEDGGPVFFTQKRYTRNQKIFTLIKFRSMIVDAEKNGARFAKSDDDRITKIGKFIRSTRIDELPQFFNILIGDMSLVGPRPERTENFEAYCKFLPEFSYRLRVKAGLTGYAQIYGKYNTTYEEKVKMDMLYIENASILMDIQLVFTTLKIMFMKESTEGFELNGIADLENEKKEKN